MKEAELIRTLRRQAVDDIVGAISCRPPEKAADYFDLALGLAPMPSREKNIVESAIRLLRVPEKELTYDSWSRLFDVVDEWSSRKTLSVSLARILREQAAQAVRKGDEPRLKETVDLHFKCEEAWPRGQPGFIAGLIKDMIHRVEAADAGDSDQKATALCVRVILDALEREGVPEGHGQLVLQIVRKSLAAEKDTSAVKRSRIRHALRLLDQIGDRSMTTQTLVRAFRDSVIAADGKTEALRPVLAEARELFTALNAGVSYGEIYRIALDSIASAHASGNFPSDVLQLLESANPEPTGLRAMLAFRGDGAVADATADWRDLVLAICREMGPESRVALFRHWLLERLKSTLASNPSGVLELVRAGAGAAGDPFPTPAEMCKLIAWSAGLAELDSARVRALGVLSGGGPGAESADAWCQLAEQIRGKLRAVDVRQWFLIGLDLLTASLQWDPVRLADATTRMRSFIQTLLLANPGCAGEAEKIVRCEREILNGTLLRACLKNIPRKDSDGVAGLYAAGLGIGMRETEILALA